MSVTDIAASVPFAWRFFASLFWIALALIFQGLAIFFIYEAVAIFTRVVPTISFVSSYEFLKHPVWWVTLACMIAFALGALVTHFTHWTP